MIVAMNRPLHAHHDPARAAFPHIAYRVQRLFAKARALRLQRSRRHRLPQQLELPLFP
jgi:hypothetical protein